MIDPIVLTSLIVACAAQSVIIALLSATVPVLIWKCFRLESKVDQLDEVVETLCKAAGLGEKP